MKKREMKALVHDCFMKRNRTPFQLDKMGQEEWEKSVVDKYGRNKWTRVKSRVQLNSSTMVTFDILEDVAKD